MIKVDECDPVGELEPSFPPRDVTIKRGIDAKECYDLIGEIGRGKFGTVYKCREKSTGLEFAAKFVPIPKREDRRNVEREVEIMNSLQHPLIIQLYDAYEYQKMMCVVLELIDGGELFDRVIDDDYVITERACVVVIRQVCQAMEFIHKSNILHLDLKPENILCLSKESNRIKVIDFGLARRYDPDKRLQILFGTPEFVAPEVVNFDTISFGTDMWSIGVICYVILSGLSPFMGETDVQTMANVTIAKYDYDDEAFNNVSVEALDFMTKLLLKDINERMTASQCLEHIWLRTKQRPQIPPKPLVIPPPKLVAKSPSPEKSLDSTKENLKNFVERWEDHPNSPYIFDSSARLISPARDDHLSNRGSALSSRGCSPSPCASLTGDVGQNGNNDDDDDQSGAGSNETICASDQNEDDNSSDMKDYLHTFDRRNSDSNYVLKKSNSTEKMNLADEIKKLSDRLMILSALKSEYSDNINDDNTEEPERPVSEAIRPPKPEIQPKPNSLMSQLSHGFRDSFSSNETNKNGTITRSTFKKTVVTVNGTTTMHEEFTESNTLEDRLKSIDELPSISNKRSKNITITRNKSFTNGSTSPPYSRWGAPWPVSNKRTKFRITQLSRDVPIGSPNSHRTIFLEEAATNTKDCLLHLLEKYDDVEKKRISSSERHQSISVGWGGVSDNLEYQSINSINAFFKRHAGAGSSIKQLAAKMEANNSKFQ